MRFLIATLALCIQASASTILFSDLGSPASYGNSPSIMRGGNTHSQNSITLAREFTVSGTGDFNVTQFDLAAVGNGGNPATFAASIWTNSGNDPGTQIGPSFDLTGSPAPNDEHTLVTQTGVTGITLTGGVEYWMVLTPRNLTDNSVVQWENNVQGSTSLLVGSNSGTTDWLSDGNGTNAAFDVLGDAVVSSAPEPASVILLATALAAMLIVIRKKALP